MNELVPYKDWIDLELTERVNDKKELKWLPFIGKDYQLMEKKILLVGLSHYL